MEAQSTILAKTLATRVSRGLPQRTVRSYFIRPSHASLGNARPRFPGRFDDEIVWRLIAFGLSWPSWANAPISEFRTVLPCRGLRRRT